MNASEIRKKFIDFFKARGHIEVPSVSLVPENDPTTLFTSAGMQPMMPYLLGEKHPLGTRIVDSQKCFRSKDIEEVGDNRHTTFFEMLGNWSFGDYFKKEQLEYIFTFLTDKKEGLGIDPNKLFVSVFNGDENQKVLVDNKYQPLSADIETIEIWKNLFEKAGIKAEMNERIFGYPANKNWWSRSGSPDKMPVGEPGGSDSEIFYDFGKELKLHENSIWKDKSCHINCDCGRFLEIGNSVFMQFFKQRDGSLKELPKKNIDFGGGLSRMEAILRNDPDIFNISTLSPLIKKIEEISQKLYSKDENKSSLRIIADHFTAAVFLIKDGVIPGNKDQGYVLRRLLRRAAIKFYFIAGGKDSLKKLTELTDVIINTYGDIYFDLNKDLFIIKKIISDEIEKFSLTIEKGIGAIDKYFKKYDIGPGFLPQPDIGAKVAFDLYQSYGLPKDAFIEELKNRFGFVYGWDNGLETMSEKFEELRAQHSKLSQTLSAGKFKSGLADNSEIITKYHTATHLLHAALRRFLDENVHQSGSNITSERLRFDFNYDQKLTEEQLKEIENFVNDQIEKSLPVTCETLKFADAQKQGALAFFGSKYPETVTVYTVGDLKDFVSKEVCTGPHIKNTSDLGIFEITKEESAGAGKRRIYAILK